MKILSSYKYTKEINISEIVFINSKKGRLCILLGCLLLRWKRNYVVIFCCGRKYIIRQKQIKSRLFNFFRKSWRDKYLRHNFL